MGGREAARARATGDRTPATTGGNGNAAGTMRQMLEQMKPELALALPKHMTPDRMARQALTAFRTTEKLAECSPQSFLGALMTCAQVGLEPGPQGHVYIIPYWNRRASSFEATFILGYQGMLELARRSGELLDVSAHTIYQGEVDAGRFDVEYGTNGSIRHKPMVLASPEERGAAVGYYARATLKTGGRPFVVLSKADVEVFRRRSATQKDNPSGPWNSDYEPMAWKTCIRRLSRWLPQSAELAAALGHEETVREVVPGSTVASVIDMQPPALDQADPEGIDGADQQTGEIPSGEGEAPPIEEPPADMWAGTAVPGEPGEPDPWAGAK